MNTDLNGNETGDAQSEKRWPHTIRFTEPEWERIEAFAGARGLSASAFVRYATLAAVEAPRGTVPGKLAPLIEATYRYVFFLATCKRVEMKAAGQNKALESVIGMTREAQAELQDPASERGGRAASK